MVKVYLAGPMRGHTVAQAMDWRFNLASDLKAYGFDAVVPGMAEGITEMDADTILLPGGEHIVEIDHHLVSSSNYLIANLGYAYRLPVGTLAEISWAYALGIPVITVSNDDIGKEPFIAAQTTLRVSTLHDALNALKTLEGQWK